MTYVPHRHGFLSLFWLVLLVVFNVAALWFGCWLVWQGWRHGALWGGLLCGLLWVGWVGLCNLDGWARGKGCRGAGG
jgi:hypothetical protein